MGDQTLEEIFTRSLNKASRRRAESRFSNRSPRQSRTIKEQEKGLRSDLEQKLTAWEVQEKARASLLQLMSPMTESEIAKEVSRIRHQRSIRIQFKKGAALGVSALQGMVNQGTISVLMAQEAAMLMIVAVCGAWTNDLDRVFTIRVAAQWDRDAFMKYIVPHIEAVRVLRSRI